MKGVTTEKPGDFHFSPDMKARMERGRAQVKQQGYDEVEKARILILDIMSMKLRAREANNKGIKSMNEGRPTLGFEPAGLRFFSHGKVELFRDHTEWSLQ